MRIQSVYVDLRPMLLKWLGWLIFFGFIYLFYASLQPDIAVAHQKIEQLYQMVKENGKESRVDFGAMDWCLRSAECQSMLIPQWTAPLIQKALILGGGLFSLICGLFGLMWRPEMIAMRDTRTNAANIEESRRLSPVAPVGKI